MANYSNKSKKVIKEILTQALEKSKGYDANWLFLCNQITFVLDESYKRDTKTHKLVLGYFKNQQPKKTGRYKEFYNHPEYRDTKIGNAWWHTNKAAKEQRLLFLEAVINNL